MSSSPKDTSNCPVVNGDKTSQNFQPRQSIEHAHNDNESIHTISTNSEPNRNIPLEHLSTHASHSHDAPIQHYSSYVEVPDEVYDRLPPHRKIIIVTLLSFCSFLAPISSTTVLAAVPEVAHTYNSTGTIINLSNALYMLFMGVSPCFWGPLSQVYGRRIVRLILSIHFPRSPRTLVQFKALVSALA
jgi:hypothetical protein